MDTIDLRQALEENKDVFRDIIPDVAADNKLDVNSKKPIQNQAVTKKFGELDGKILNYETEPYSNMFIISDLVLPGYLQKDGSIRESHAQYGWKTSQHYIPCKASTNYYCEKVENAAVLFLDKDKKPIQYITTPHTKGLIQSPSNAAFVRFSDTNSGAKTFLFAESDIEVPYTKGLPPKINKIYLPNGLVSEFSSDILPKNEFIEEYGENLLIADDLTVVGYLQPSGNLSVEEHGIKYGWRTSKHFVKCKPNTHYICSVTDNNCACIVYNSDLVIIEHHLGVNPFVTPADAAYLKFSTPKKDVTMFVEGEVLPERYVRGRYPFLNYNGMPISGYNSENSSNSNTLKYATIGTSITFRGKYQKIIDKYTGMEHINLGISGGHAASFAFHRLPLPSNDVDRLLLASDFEGVSAITICGYANNVWTPIGKMEDEYVTISEEGFHAAGSVSAYQRQIGAGGYIPSLRSVIEYIIKLCPTIPILLATELPMSRPVDRWDGEPMPVDFRKVYQGSNATIWDFAKAMEDVATYYSLPFVNMVKDGQVNILNYTQYYDGQDYTHPNFKELVNGEFPNSGMKRMAHLMMDGLAKIIKW